MELRVVLVEPMYQVNLGYIARVAKNFGIRQLNLVNPRCKYVGKEAVKYSKHASELLEGARVFKSLKAAVKGTFVLGTTALWRKTGEAFHNVYTLEGFIRLARRNKIRSVSVLIGRDDTGLTKEELSMCDATVFIPTNDGYPSLNISHALGIILYALSARENEIPLKAAASPEEIARLRGLFNRMISKRRNIRDRKAVQMSFDHILMRSNPTKKEVSALSIAFSPRHAAQRRVR